MISIHITFPHLFVPDAPPEKLLIGELPMTVSMPWK